MGFIFDLLLQLLLPRQWRILKGFRRPAPPISVTIGAVATERQRKQNDGEKWKVSLDSEIVELTTDAATLEWAVPTKRLKLALERLQSAEIPSG